MSTAATLANIGKIARNSDALTAAAFGAVNASPEVKAILGPIAKSVFDAGYKIVSSQASALEGALVGTLSSIVGEQAIESAIGIAGDVASAAGDLAPVVSTIVSLVSAFNQIAQANEDQAKADQNSSLVDFLRQTTGSGTNDEVTPADLFNPRPETWSLPLAQQAATWYRPNSPLGACLVALTEDADMWGFDPSPQDWFTIKDIPMQWVDNNLLHPRVALDAAIATERALAREVNDPNFGTFQGIAKPGGLSDFDREEHDLYANDLSVGIDSASRRDAYRALRMAIGSHSTLDQHGDALFSIYMSMLSDDVRRGHLNLGWMKFQLGMVFVFDYDNPSNPRKYITTDTLRSDLSGGGATDTAGGQAANFIPGAPLSYDQCGVFANQILAMVAAWDANAGHVSPMTSSALIADANRKHPFGMPDPRLSASVNAARFFIANRKPIVLHLNFGAMKKS
jgi:hypothetical protein